MANGVDFNKSITMDYVYNEILNIISTLIVKKQYMADRYETVETLQQADEYIAAVEKSDLFISYATYSDYALQKAGLYDEKYKKYKYNIPEEKRDEVLAYQREYVISNYEEPNNYYRSLAGLPDIGDEYIYISEVTDEEIEGVDSSKPIHEMTKSEATILKVYGILDKLIEKYPKKEYLKHIDYEYKIDIIMARKSNDFDILYIKKDRTKQGVSDNFIGIYRQSRDYVMNKFYDDTYKKDSPYYDAFIGIFILTITIQRYISNYMEKFINRDFYDKDIIKLLFESYGLPFYNDIPISYLQKVCKNLNRLLYYKATDRVFVDIFKIFDLDNIDIYNYVLFKDNKLDSKGKPIEVYKEKTELGYEIDTKTYSLINSNTPKDYKYVEKKIVTRDEFEVFYYVNTPFKNANVIITVMEPKTFYVTKIKLYDEDKQLVYSIDADSGDIKYKGNWKKDFNDNTTYVTNSVSDSLSFNVPVEFKYLSIYTKKASTNEDVELNIKTDLKTTTIPYFIGTRTGFKLIHLKDDVYTFTFKYGYPGFTDVIQLKSIRVYTDENNYMEYDSNNPIINYQGKWINKSSSDKSIMQTTDTNASFSIRVKCVGIELVLQNPVEYLNISPVAGNIGFLQSALNLFINNIKLENITHLKIELTRGYLFFHNLSSSNHKIEIYNTKDQLLRIDGIIYGGIEIINGEQVSNQVKGVHFNTIGDGWQKIEDGYGDNYITNKEKDYIDIDSFNHENLTISFSGYKNDLPSEEIDKYNKAYENAIIYLDGKIINKTIKFKRDSQTFSDKIKYEYTLSKSNDYLVKIVNKNKLIFSSISGGNTVINSESSLVNKVGSGWERKMDYNGNIYYVTNRINDYVEFEINSNSFTIDFRDYYLTDKDINLNYKVEIKDKEPINFYGIKHNTELTNMKKTIYINNCYIYLHNNGIIDFKGVNISYLKDLKYETYDEFIRFTDNMCITDIQEIKGKNYDKVIFKTEYANKFYIFDNKNQTIKKEIPIDYFKNSHIDDIMICADKNISGNIYVAVQTNDGKGRLFVKGSILNLYFDDYTMIYETDFGISFITGNYGSIILIDNSHRPFVYGNNDFNRLHVPNETEITTFEEIGDRIYEPKCAYIFNTGTLFVMMDGLVRITGNIPEISDIDTTPGENEIMQGYKSVKEMFEWEADKNIYFFIHYNGDVDIINYTSNNLMGPLLYKEDVQNPIIRYHYIKNLAPIEHGLMVTVYDTDSYIRYTGENKGGRFPFIRTLSLIEEPNERNMKEVELYKDVLYYVDKDNNLYQYYNGEYRLLELPKYKNPDVSVTNYEYETQLIDYNLSNYSCTSYIPGTYKYTMASKISVGTNFTAVIDNNYNLHIFSSDKTLVSNLSTNIKLKEIYAGDSNYLAIGEDGYLYACGQNKHSDLGLDTGKKIFNKCQKVVLGSSSVKPVKVNFKSGITFILGNDGYWYFCGSYPINVHFSSAHTATIFTKLDNLGKNEIQDIQTGTTKTGKNYYLVYYVKDNYLYANINGSTFSKISNTTVKELQVSQCCRYPIFIGGDNYLYSYGKNKICTYTSAYGQNISINDDNKAKRLYFGKGVNQDIKAKKLCVGNHISFFISEDDKIYTFCAPYVLKNINNEFLTEVKIPNGEIPKDIKIESTTNTFETNPGVLLVLTQSGNVYQYEISEITDKNTNYLNNVTKIFEKTSSGTQEKTVTDYTISSITSTLNSSKTQLRFSFNINSYITFYNNYYIQIKFNDKIIKLLGEDIKSDGTTKSFTIDFSIPNSEGEYLLEFNICEIRANKFKYFTPSKVIKTKKTIITTIPGEYVRNEDIQALIQSKESLFLTVGKKYFYVLNETLGIILVDTNLNVVTDLLEDDGNLFIFTVDGFIYKITSEEFNKELTNTSIVLDKSKLTKVEYYTCTHEDENKKATISPIVENGILNFYLDYENGDLKRYCKVNNIYNCKRICISDKVIFIEGKYIEYIKIDDIEDEQSETNGVNAYFYDEINEKRAYSERIDNTIVIYNRKGGITIFKDFPHLDKLDSYIEGDYVCLYDKDEGYIEDISFSDTDLMMIAEKNKTVTYEPVVEKMYNLKFIETPMDSKNIAEQFVNTANYLDYDLVVHDDKLWGGDGDKSEFINEVLSSEFNYVTSKYISIDCRYEITQLNFEVCYMFRLLVDLKPNEEYLTFDVPYVGTVKLFDCIVALFAITCKKFGFDGSIMDTTTKTLSVLGFNFNQDIEYIENVVKKAKLDERTNNFKIENVEIKQPPEFFLDSAEVINSYLNNMDVVQAIYDYKYNAKTIKEYNAYKRILQATAFTKYTTDMYRKKDGSLPKTYLDYLRVANPDLYAYVQETTDENMVDQIDNLLVSLDKYMATDKFKFLFLNIPSLSLDNIRRFIYYLVDVFKSYTVELKAMNIIYHVDDKRIHNIKLVLQEQDFEKYFRNYTRIELNDYFDYLLGKFDLYTDLKFKMLGDPKAKFTYDDIKLLFKLYEIIPNKFDEKRLSLLTDFADVFDTMDETMGYKKRMEILDKSFKETLIPVLEKGLKNMHSKVDFEYKISRKDAYKIITKMTPLDKTQFKEKILIKMRNQLYELYNIRYEKTIIKINELLDNYNKLNDTRDVIALDFSDHIETNSKLVQQNNNIKIKDYFYFERTEKK